MFLRALALLTLLSAPTFAADPPKKPKRPGKPPAAKKSDKPPTAAQTTPAAGFKIAKDFAVDLVYAVPKAEQGSWVCLCVDPKGRIVASDQYGALYRVTLAADPKAAPKVEKLTVDIGMAQGLLYAHDALYVVVNDGKKGGLYRVTDTNGDDMPDKVELLRALQGGGGEHGPHAVISHPDGKRLTVVCGNQTKLTDLSRSDVPLVYGDDLLLPRVPDGNGFMNGVLAPGGCIYNVDPDGKNWELVSNGFRNEYDAAYNRAGQLFTYFADMEWDMNLPWYRPTRVCHVVPGSEWGWRNGAGKYREYYPDNLPPVVNIGAGSPTGVTFGYGAKFPAKYQDALFMCDWSYGKLYAVHMDAKGASYTGLPEEFLTGTPLPLTDIVINPKDGAMYFAVGGRRVQSGLYRVTYTGKESIAPSQAKPVITEAAKLRERLESLADRGDAAAVAEAWPHLGSEDRFVRFAARVVLERAKSHDWYQKAFALTEPTAALNALLAVARTGAPDPLRTKLPVAHKVVDAEGLFGAIGKMNPADFTVQQKLDYLRVLQVALHRFDAPTGMRLNASFEFNAENLASRVLSICPSGNRLIDAEALPILVHLKHPKAAAIGMKLLAGAHTQEEEIDYAMPLRVLQAGWTPELRKSYFEWFARAQNYKGGNSIIGYLKQIKADALTSLPEADKVALQTIIDAKPAAVAMLIKPRPFVKSWSLDEVAPVVETKLKAGGRDYDRGRRLFGQASCFACHRYDNEGGNTGPDLSGVAGRFSPRELLESIVLPSKAISDQYEAVKIATLDGRLVTGRIINYDGDNIRVNVNGLDPNAIVAVNRADVDTIEPSKLSMMPEGLLNTLTPDEAADLCAYLLSRGDRGAAVFKK